MLCFGVVRPYKGVDVLRRRVPVDAGAELWVVGRPLGVSIEAARLRRERTLRAALRERLRAARLLPARRPAGAPRTARSTSRACSSPGSPSASRWSSPTWAASARSCRPRRRAPGAARATRARWGRHRRAACRPRRARAPGGARPRRGGRPLLLGPVAEQTLAVYEEVLAR